MSDLKEKISRFYEMLAPNIIGNSLTKKLVTLQIFTNPKVGEKLHILLTGEPASGKTVIGYDTSLVCPNSSYSASNLTRVGLFEKLIATDGGILVIDEFGRLVKNVRDGLLEAMQTGTVSIDKHDAHARYKSRVNILAISNPKGNRLVSGMPITRQLPYGLALLSRFHLIIPFWSVSEDMYPEIAKNLTLTYEDERRILALRDIVTKAKSKIPVVKISSVLAEEIGNFVKLLKNESFTKEVISPRMIEGIFSMVKANARMNLRSNANKEDLKYVIDLVNELNDNMSGMVNSVI